MMMLPQGVTDKLEGLPVSPGVYLFKDRQGVVVYVGKAKSLRARVRSYFQEGTSDARTFIPVLQRTLGDLDTIVVGSEKEAAILENTLIKEYRPRYNVKLRDDKEYISLRLAAKEPWPRLRVVRRPTPDGARYFGPYHSASAARRTLHLVNKHFQLRTCTDVEMRARRRPCLQYQIKRCPAPCVLEVDPGWYEEQVRAVSMFLDGRHDELSRLLDERMRQAAGATQFELAGVYRDQLLAIEKVREEQRVVSVDDHDRDVVGLHREGDLVEIALLRIRRGKLSDVEAFSIKNAEIPDDEVIAAFVSQRYVQDGGEGETLMFVPDEIVVPLPLEAAGGLAEWLTECAGHRVAIVVPQRGAKAHLLRLASDNARHSFSEKRRASDDVRERLAQLQERLRLPTLPRRIECCDISHLGGRDTVGAVVSFLDGEPDKKRYRSFHVRGLATASAAPSTSQGQASPDQAPVGAGDDYRAMYEVLARRFRRGARRSDGEQTEAAGEWELPDLLVVDGGRGQLAVALAAAHDLGLHDLPIVALAKEKENVAGDVLVDRVYLPGQKNPIPLKSHSASLFFLARARDEAHRFSNRAREKLGKARRFRSALDDVVGLGPATRVALLRELGSLEKIRTATDAQLLAVSGVTARHVKALRRSFSGG